MRRLYRQTPDGELVEVGEGYGNSMHEIMPDIAPYRSVITGERIDGRAAHREHLKQHGCIEVGSERQQPKPMRQISRPERRDAIRKAICDLKYNRVSRRQS